MNVFRETSREFATGDRLQFTALNKELGISNRDMGTITKMEPDRLTVLMDGKEQRSVSFDPKEFRQFDHGYAVTSHSAQGLTTGRVIANIDTDSSRSLINTRLAYVAISRASEDARIYTNNAETLGQRLATDVTKTAALDFTARMEQQPATPQVSKAPTVHEYNNQDSRLAAVATDYLRRPEGSVIVAPNRAEREELTQLVRSDLYSKGQLGRDAQAVPVLVEKDSGSRMRAEAYEPGDKIHFKTGSPGIDHIPHDSEATVLSKAARQNLITVQIDNTRETVTYNPAQLKTQTRESRMFQEESSGDCGRGTHPLHPLRQRAGRPFRRPRNRRPRRPGQLHDREARFRQDRRSLPGEVQAHRLRLRRRELERQPGRARDRHRRRPHPTGFPRHFSEDRPGPVHRHTSPRTGIFSSQRDHRARNQPACSPATARLRHRLLTHNYI